MNDRLNDETATATLKTIVGRLREGKCLSADLPILEEIRAYLKTRGADANMMTAIESAISGVRQFLAH